MTTKEIIEMLRVCADDDIICPACPRYEQYEYGGTAECREKLMQEAAIREQEQRRWIPVTERPKARGYYLVTVKHWLNGNPVTREAFWNDEDWLSCEKYREITPRVTHWMPLPEPPKEDANATM